MDLNKRFNFIKLLALSVFAFFVFINKSTANPTTIFVNGIEILIQFETKRDVGPVTRNDASGVIIQLDIISKHRQKLPDSIKLTQAQATYNDDTWHLNQAADKEEKAYFDQTGYSFIFRQGPSWPIDAQINLSLVLRIGDHLIELDSLKARIVKTPI